MRTALTVLVSFLCSATLAAQDSAATADTVRMRRDSIFAAIMQSLPRQLRVRVDSARALRLQPGAGRDTAVAAQRTVSARDTARGGATLEELSAELRERIQQTVRDIEREQQGRPVEFKDQKAGPRR